MFLFNQISKISILLEKDTNKELIGRKEKELHFLKNKVHSASRVAAVLMFLRLEWRKTKPVKLYKGLQVFIRELKRNDPQ